MKIAISSIGRFHMFDLARQMLRLGQEVTLFTGNPMCRVDKDLRPYTQTHPILHTLSVLSHRMPFPAQIPWWQDRDHVALGKWLARSVDPQTVDILDGLDGPGPDAGRRLKSAGKVWICNRGSAHILTQKSLLEDEYRRWGLTPPSFSRSLIERCLAEYAEADAVVVPSDFAKRSFAQHGISSDQVFVRPYGVDLSLFHPLRKADSTFRVLFVGSMSVRKGIGYLLDALRPLVEKRHCELWLIGPIDRSAKRILDKNKDLFLYQGVHARSNLASLYSLGSVLVLPSIEEGLGLVQAQAMACGLPVIGTSHSGAENLFTDGVEGFIVPIRDPLAIRTRIEWMIEHPAEVEQMRIRALQRVKLLGGWDQYGEQCLAMYHELLHRKRLSHLN